MLSKIPEEIFFRMLLVLVITVSLSGVLVALYYHDHEEGGRGGAIAVGLSLFTLFGTRNYAEDVYVALTAKKPERKRRLIELMKVDDKTQIPNNNLEKKFEALEKRLEIESQGQELQNFYLALSSAIGTVFWGFGDKFAFWIMCFKDSCPS